MRSTMHILARNPDSVRGRSRSPQAPSHLVTPPPPSQIPTIRLVQATPGAEANSSSNTSFNDFNGSIVSVPSPLVPRHENEGPRKRLVPKKSKLGLLGGRKEKGKDLSDVVRRVGGSASTGRGGFEIYVEPTDDPDLDDIVVVKKQKSRAALDGISWGPSTLGEVTNTAEPGNGMKAKVDKEKWWAMGRGRRDSKEKTKGRDTENVKPRSKTPEPRRPFALKQADSRARFNSLDSGILLTTPTALQYSGAISGPPSGAAVPMPVSTPPFTSSRLEVPSPTLLAPSDAPSGPGTGSIAIRAMRSMRSLARIGSWAQLVNPEKDASINAKTKPTKEEKDAKTESKKKNKKKGKERPMTMRTSTSSFEAGALSPSSVNAKSLGKKKHSVLGLGWPSTVRLGTTRNTSSSSNPASQDQNRLSVESSINVDGGRRDRAASTISTGSSLRPLSSASERTGKSSSGSVVSVKWDEQVLETVKERTKKERRIRREASTEREKNGKTSSRGERESRRTSASRRRTPVTELFHEANPLLTLEEATEDGHPNQVQNIPSETPVKPARPRPVSEQLLRQARPAGMYDDGDGYMSILDAATNELASLIDRLDLEATPRSVDTSHFKSTSGKSRPKVFSQPESPIKRKVDMGNAKKGPERAGSIASIRPYAQSRSKASRPDPSQIIGQQIAPWPTSPVKEKSKTLRDIDTEREPLQTFRLTHKRTMSPAPAPAPDPPLVFQPLRPARPRPPPASRRVLSTIKDAPSPSNTRTPRANQTNVADPSSLTFGSRPSKTAMVGPNHTERDHSPTPVFRKAPRNYERALDDEDHSRDSMPIPREARRGLGLRGTMGGSIGSTALNVNPDDPDSDIPDELQVILSGHSENGSIRSVDDTLSFPIGVFDELPPSPGLPPMLPLPDPVPRLSLEIPMGVPVFRAQLNDEDGNQADIEEGLIYSPAEDDTKKSFDFTGELNKLNESGASDRRSFIEQLENAFRTPVQFDLQSDFCDNLGVDEGLWGGPVPLVPQIPDQFEEETQHGQDASLPADSFIAEDASTRSPKLEVPELAFECKDFERDSDLTEDLQGSKYANSIRCRSSDGQLNREFKFGGLTPSPRSPASEEKQEKPLTLSDIIPPPSHVRTLSGGSIVEEDSSVLKSIFAKVTDIPVSSPRLRLDSDSNSKRKARDLALSRLTASHARHESGMSFEGLDSFEEIRRGFEFHPNLPAFYPPRQATSRGRHIREESMFSFASVSSYGMVLNSGAKDPFDYGLPSRPSSEDTSSMSMSVDDTFSFLKHEPQRKRVRVDSDASSFYFRAPASSHDSQISRRGHGRRESGISIASQLSRRGHRRHESGISIASIAPPISLYNRSFGGHRRHTSNSSASSVAQNYALYGANGGRVAWAKHRPDPSIDSMLSDFSAMRLGRPELGDKMFESAAEQGMPLTSILASPPESVASQRAAHRPSYDSIIDNDRRSSMDDSLFEMTGYRSSVSSESVFGYDNSYPYDGSLLPANQFRPVSMFSVASAHSPQKEDDTMISMLGGGHVRRRSVGSVMDASPCVRFGKRKNQEFDEAVDLVELDHAHRLSRHPALVEKPSLASTSSYQFGGERMQQARRGLLERQSLEERCISADGESNVAFSWEQPAASRAGRTSRPRSGTYASSGSETPPLSSDGSSQSGDSQSSIDVSHLDNLLANVTYPMTNRVSARARARSRGEGHRRRITQARASRCSVYETIQEEMPALSMPPTPVGPISTDQSATSANVCDPVFIVQDQADTVEWDDERGITVLRRYYALQHEVQETVQESKRVWVDTPFSVFAVQSFQPPTRREGMQALLEHSQQNYGPLPSELGPQRMRSRADSRPSPYPRTKVSISPEDSGLLHLEQKRSAALPRQTVLQQVPLNHNVLSPPPALEAIKVVSPLTVDFDKSKQDDSMTAPPIHRPRVTSSARRTALGWARRSTTAKQKENKENANEGSVMSAPQSLRINRPRPRGRPTPARRQPLPV